MSRYLGSFNNLNWGFQLIPITKHEIQLTRISIPSIPRLPGVEQAVVVARAGQEGQVLVRVVRGEDALHIRRLRQLVLRLDQVPHIVRRQCWQDVAEVLKETRVLEEGKISWKWTGPCGGPWTWHQGFLENWKPANKLSEHRWRTYSSNVIWGPRRKRGLAHLPIMVKTELTSEPTSIAEPWALAHSAQWKRRAWKWLRKVCMTVRRWNNVPSASKTRLKSYKCLTIQLVGQGMRVFRKIHAWIVGDTRTKGFFENVTLTQKLRCSQFN